MLSWKVGAVTIKRVVETEMVFRHQPGFHLSHRRRRAFLGHFLHAVKGPKEVHRGGPGRGDFPADLLKLA